MSQELSNRVAYLEAINGIYEGKLASSVNEMVALAKTNILSGVDVPPAVREKLVRLFGTTLLEGLYIIAGLRESAHLPGAVCEFGVAQGRTSALLAATLMSIPSDKELWLYDSFEGLPAPSDKDNLLHDMFRLGSMQAYKGQLASPETEVLHELGLAGFPSSRVRLVKGWIEEKLAEGLHPPAVSFAFLDMDFYRSTLDTLRLLRTIMPAGGRIVVDDYGFFSSGVQTAVEEVMAETPGAFELVHPFGLKFVALRRL